MRLYRTASVRDLSTDFHRFLERRHPRESLQKFGDNEFMAIRFAERALRRSVITATGWKRRKQDGHMLISKHRGLLDRFGERHGKAG